ncbi:hypothetical protein Pan14r_08640 [Crateriforma conspicua]|uniref:Uncharacterized protein n=1 Tax=Crateriforma conspicua TaxID=2527996 RepID=A0A5C5XZ10_9PLAN|nr:hypothetical protein Pan14r_08640 [Crateriforma conspicua]
MGPSLLIVLEIARLPRVIIHYDTGSDDLLCIASSPSA